MQIETLNEESLKPGCELLAKLDSDLSFIYKTHGTPPLWQRKEGFPTLVHIILEQQVSLASARAAFTKLKQTIKVTPKNFLTLDDAALKTVGFSRQKTLYCRLLAQSILEKQLDLKSLSNMKDEDVRTTLKKLKGIGDWTVDIYLLMSLLRADIFPQGDLALIVAMQKLKRFSARPTNNEMNAIAENWKPYRAVAARLLWHYYLSKNFRQDKQDSLKTKNGL